jgi:hypothetical protein
MCNQIFALSYDGKFGLSEILEGKPPCFCLFLMPDVIISNASRMKITTVTKALSFQNSQASSFRFCGLR